MVPMAVPPFCSAAPLHLQGKCSEIGYGGTPAEMSTPFHAAMRHSL
jgi:hypothetical protein